MPICLDSAAGCFRLERLPGGACTHWKAPPSHGAHANCLLPTFCSGPPLQGVRLAHGVGGGTPSVHGPYTARSEQALSAAGWLTAAAWGKFLTGEADAKVVAQSGRQKRS